jgi:hypothetical protein
MYWFQPAEFDRCPVSVCKRRIGLTGTALQNKYEARRIFYWKYNFEAFMIFG